MDAEKDDAAPRTTLPEAKSAGTPQARPNGANAAETRTARAKPAGDPNTAETLGRRLVNRWCEQLEDVPPVDEGDPVPRLRLKGLDGVSATLDAENCEGIRAEVERIDRVGKGITLDRIVVHADAGSPKYQKRESMLRLQWNGQTTVVAASHCDAPVGAHINPVEVTEASVHSVDGSTYWTATLEEVVIEERTRLDEPSGEMFTDEERSQDRAFLACRLDPSRIVCGSTPSGKLRSVQGEAELLAASTGYRDRVSVEGTDVVRKRDRSEPIEKPIGEPTWTRQGIDDLIASNPHAGRVLPCSGGRSGLRALD